MDQIFNELSVSSSYADQYVARTGMENTIAVSIGLSARGFSPDIRTREGFCTRELAAKYTVGQWAVDRSVDNDIRRYFLTHATKAPYVEILVQENEDPEEIYEFLFDGEEALGLGLASLWKSPSLSLCGDDRFATDPVLINQRVLKDGDIQEEEVEVCTLCRHEQIDIRAEWLQSRLQESVNNGNKLIENREQLLPHLRFCQNAIDQIIELNGNEQYFHEIVRHLFVLERAIREWEDGALHLGNVKFSGESESTMSNHTFRKMRIFLCQDGEERIFTLHTKIMSANKRICFLPILQERIIHIGHVGSHLPTVLYPK